jgi:hypothetical protein
MLNMALDFQFIYKIKNTIVIVQIVHLIVLSPHHQRPMVEMKLNLSNNPYTPTYGEKEHKFIFIF